VRGIELKSPQSPLENGRLNNTTHQSVVVVEDRRIIGAPGIWQFSCIAYILLVSTISSVSLNCLNFPESSATGCVRSSCGHWTFLLRIARDKGGGEHGSKRVASLRCLHGLVAAATAMSVYVVVLHACSVLHACPSRCGHGIVSCAAVAQGSSPFPSTRTFRCANLRLYAYAPSWRLVRT
jgi:hypothetical protein